MTDHHEGHGVRFKLDRTENHPGELEPIRLTTAGSKTGEKEKRISNQTLQSFYSFNIVQVRILFLLFRVSIREMI